MKNIYSTLNLKFLLITCCLFFCGLLNAYSQVADRTEKVEQDVSVIRDQVYQNLKTETGMPENEFNEFTHYYVDTLAKYIHRSFVYLKKHPEATINSPAIQKYITEKTSYYVQLYSNFKKIKAEFPSSVAEALYPGQPNKGPTIPCNPACNNFDFSNGTLSAWYVGYASNSSEDVGSCPPASGGPAAFSHTAPVWGTSAAANEGGPDPSTGNDYQVNIVGPGIDPIVGIPMVYPGYAFAAEIGDGSKVNFGVALMEQKFQVTPNNIDFYYHYAVILNNPSHCYHQQPYFQFAVLDQNGDTIPGCGNYSIVAGSGGGNWKYLNQGTGNEIDYLPWTSGFVSLKKYLGQCVTVIIITSDCGQGGHYGYAYFDASCQGFNITSSAPSKCSTPDTLTAPVAASYKWVGPCITGFDTTQSVNISCIGTYSVILKNTIGGTCADTLSINVTPGTPVIGIVSSPVNDTVCPGSSITLAGTGGKTYNWSGGITNGIAFSPSVSGQYVVTGTDSVGCSGKDSVTVITGSGSLPVITATSIPASDTICIGSQVTLTGNGASYYNWSGGVKNGISFSPSSSGKYIVTGTGTNGCSNTDTVNVVVKQGPVINISGQNLIAAGTSDTLTASGAISYIWSTGSTNDTTIVAPNSTTTYTITATGANGCSDTSSYTVTIKTVTGINTINSSSGLILYPNPANRILNLAFNTQGKTLNAEIKIADITGKELIKMNSELKGNKMLPIDISSLSTGIYFISIETNSTVKTFKFVKN